MGTSWGLMVGNVGNNEGRMEFINQHWGFILIKYIEGHSDEAGFS